MKNSKYKKKTSAEPIKELGDIEKLRAILRERPRDRLLFELAIQTGARIDDLLNLKVKDLMNLKSGDGFPLASGKTKGTRKALMSETIRRNLMRYLDETSLTENEYLFESRKGTDPLTVSGVSRLVNTWLKSIDQEGLRGWVSLRKTWEHHFKDQSQGKEVAFQEQDSLRFLDPIGTETLQERVYDELFKTISSGRLPPGEPLITEKIASRMNISHMPVREALHRLEAGGFIIRLKKRGYVVNRLDKENLNEITKLRIVLEPMAAEAACARLTDKTLSRIMDIQQQFEQAVNNKVIAEMLRLDKEFHQCIYEAANMPILQKMIEELRYRISPYFHMCLRAYPNYDPHNFIITHRQILDQLKRRNAKELVEWLRKDIQNGANVYIGMFDYLRR